MKRRSFLAFSLFIFLFSFLFLCSCTSAEENYKKGNYEASLKTLEKKKNLDLDEYLLKANCLLALDKKEEALKYYMLFLLLSDNTNSNTSSDRQEALSNFILLNKSDYLTALIVSPNDGFDAKISLYKAYSRLKRTNDAIEILEILKNEMTYENLISLAIETPLDGTYIANLFSLWQANIESIEDKQAILELLLQYTETLEVSEEASRKLLETTDLLIGDSYYVNDNILLSKLLRIKGNILEKLYDRVNARIYWSQALKLNPQDTVLEERLSQ